MVLYWYCHYCDDFHRTNWITYNNMPSKDSKVWHTRMSVVQQHINRDGTQQTLRHLFQSVSSGRCCQTSSKGVKVYPQAQWCSRKLWQCKDPSGSFCMFHYQSFLLVSCLSALVSPPCVSLLLSQLFPLTVCGDLRRALNHQEPDISLRFLCDLILSKWSVAVPP